MRRVYDVYLDLTKILVKSYTKSVTLKVITRINTHSFDKRAKNKTIFEQGYKTVFNYSKKV